MTINCAIDLMIAELDSAVKKHPVWPTDIIHATSIMMEEAGESVQAANDVFYSSGDTYHLVNHLAKELAQTGAMCIRALINLYKE